MYLRGAPARRCVLPANELRTAIAYAVQKVKIVMDSALARFDTLTETRCELFKFCHVSVVDLMDRSATYGSPIH